MSDMIQNRRIFSLTEGKWTHHISSENRITLTAFKSEGPGDMRFGLLLGDDPIAYHLTKEQFIIAVETLAEVPMLSFPVDQKEPSPEREDPKKSETTVTEKLLLRNKKLADALQHFDAWVNHWAVFSGISKGEIERLSKWLRDLISENEQI